MITKQCSTCKENKPLSEYHTNKCKPDGLHNYCKVCWKSYRRKHYLENKQKYIDKSKRWRHERRDSLAALKKTLSCAHCEENHPAVLEFHHEDPKKKEGSISKLALEWADERLRKELDKCTVLCANCHRKLHYSMRADSTRDVQRVSTP